MTQSLNLETLQKYGHDLGPSFFIFDEGKFQENFTEFRSCFEKHYEKVEISYSYKTNYLPEICEVQKFGGKAEIVSEMELFLAQKLGVPPCQIIFNGPIKTSASVKEVLLGGGIINNDSKLDLELVLSAAPLIKLKPVK